MEVAHADNFDVERLKATCPGVAAWMQKEESSAKAKRASKSGTDQNLRAALLQMNAEDQGVRKNISGGTPDAQTQQRESEVDRTHLTELRRIVAASGIPSPSTVGTDGVQAFWMLVQHTPDVELQKRALGAFESVDFGVQRDEIAALADKIRRNEGRPQIYGSQFHVQANRLVPDPIKDEKHVGARRAKMGMMPLSDYTCMINSLYGFKSP